MTEFITYAACCIVFETIYMAFAWKGIKKKLSSHEAFGFVKMFLQGETLKSLKKKILNWYTIPFIAVIWCVICPILAPVTILSKLRSLIFGKSKSTKLSQQQTVQMLDNYDKAIEASKVFMKTEHFEQPKIAPPGFGIENPDGTQRNGQRPEAEK